MSHVLVEHRGRTNGAAQSAAGRKEIDARLAVEAARVTDGQRARGQLTLASKAASNRLKKLSAILPAAASISREPTCAIFPPT